jgi:hypothetical protein
VVTALRKHAFRGRDIIPSTRPAVCLESWVAYVAWCARQRRCSEAPPIGAGEQHSLFVDATGRLLACGNGIAGGHGDNDGIYTNPTPVAAMADVRVRSQLGSRRAFSLGIRAALP